MTRKTKLSLVDGLTAKVDAINGNIPLDKLRSERAPVCAQRKDQNPAIAREKQIAKDLACRAAALYIHYVLKSTGMTQVSLAKKVGVTPSRIGNIYKMRVGKNGSIPGVNLSFLIEIERATNIPYHHHTEYPAIIDNKVQSAL